MSEENNKIQPDNEEEIIIEAIDIDDEMKRSYMEYSMSVIVSRALPDVRDGLKPVHRRILYSMYEQNLNYKRPFKKSAAVVGDVLGKYHPHGDTAVYDAMVRMAQDFSLLHPLIDGQGNFGSVDGDPAAAYRYTEARKTRIGGELLRDIEKNTVDFTPNFDARLKEPVVLPAAFPNLLINGSSGIAVGMATNIPPHNLREVIEACCLLIEEPVVTDKELYSVIKGPDFPTGGVILGTRGIMEACTTGHGSIRIRGTVNTQTVESSRRALIITEIPFQVNKAKLIGNIAELVKDKTITGIADLRDESDRNGMRIVVELKNDANDLVILNQLYKHTQLLKTFGGNYLALVNGRPERLSIRQCLEYFINHRHDVVLRRTIYELNKAEARAHILEGLLKAIAIIDEIIAIIKASKRPDIAKTELIKRFAFTEIQAQAILDMRLRKLTGLEKEELKFEYDELMEIIVRLRILAEQRPERMKLIAEELREISEIFGQDRKTIIDPNAPDILELEDLIDDTDVIVTISKAGYIKRMALDVYKSQRRGGRGITGAKTREEDYLEQIFISSNLSYILFFTNRGKCHWLKVYEIPEVTRISTGKAIVNLLNLEEGETPVAHVCVKEFSEDRYILMATSNGLVKKTKLSAYSHPRTGGIWAIKLDEGTELIAATLTTGNWEVLLAMKNGKANRFSETEVRSMSRHTRGVKGIRIAENDALVDMLVMEEPVSILTISERGYGKRTHAEEYRLTHRGSGGVINIRNLERNGPVISAMAVEDDDELILISAAGMIIRLKVNEIRETRRSTMGVRIMKLPDNDRVVDAAIVRLDEDEDADEIIDDENNGSSK